MADFDEALSALLDANLAQSFTTLQREQTSAENKEAHDIRMDPASDENRVTWSLSQWSNLRVSQILHTEPQGANHMVPAEYQEIRNIFPSFYESFPDAN